MRNLLILLWRGEPALILGGLGALLAVLATTLPVADWLRASLAGVAPLLAAAATRMRVEPSVAE